MAENKVLLDFKEKIEVTPEVIRNFVKNLALITDNIKEKRADLKEVVESNEEIQQIDDEISELKERRKNIIETNAVIVAYKEELDESIQERKDLISDAKRDGVPRDEIDVAIKMLKKDIDPAVAAEVFANIADLVD